MAELASSRKITFHQSKLLAYLRHEPIFPVTLELDLTSVCNRKCLNCPSTTTLPAYHLSTDFVERLFAQLEGRTHGLLLTGGEPTMAPNFVEALALARQSGFTDVVVVTNGSFLDDESVARALLAHASAVRISMYDWSDKSTGGLAPTLQRIERLRARIEEEKSPLRIGVSALTSNRNLHALRTVAGQAASAGAHWIYFHPTCIHWEAGAPVQIDQRGVLAQIKKIQSEPPAGLQVYVFDDRYQKGKLEFTRYHASHFLLVVGADGKNYLGPEGKYMPQNVIADVVGDWRADFLSHPERWRRIDAVTSRNCPSLTGKHRGILYNSLLEQMLQTGLLPESNGDYLFPHIL